MAENTPAAPAPLPLPFPKWALDQVAERQAAVGGGNTNASPRQAEAAADHMIARGVPVDQVKAAMTGTDWQPDDRSAAQCQHDALHGVEPTIHTTDYQYQLPPAAKAEPPEAVAAFDQNVRGLIGDLGFSQGLGSNLAQKILAAGSQLRGLDEGQRAATLAKWTDQCRGVLGGEEGLEASAKDVSELLSLAENREFLALVQKSGVLKSPAIWVSLVNRAQAFKLWRSTRPTT